MSIHVVLFDIGGVIVKWKDEWLYNDVAKKFGLSEVLLVNEGKKELSHLRSIKYSALENERIIKQIPHGKIVRIFSKTIDHLYERKSVVVGHELLAEALNQGMKNIHKL